jgi:hypothetical protein
MALSEYLRGLRVAEDKPTEQFLQNVSGYTKNRDLLKALNVEDKSAPKQGLFSKFLTAVNAPGNIARGLILTGIGKTPEGIEDEGVGSALKKLATGEVQARGSDFLPEKTGNENWLDNVTRAVAGFGIETALDPLSYVGAPSSISRKAGAQLLLTSSNDLKLLEKVVGRSSKKAGLVEDLVKANPVGKAAELEKASGLTAETGTALKRLSGNGAKEVAAETLADRLGTKFLSEGRSGLLKELTDITGDRTAALSIFKELPDDVRGGLVLTGLTGKPVVRKSGPNAGKMLRLPGTGEGRSYGKLTDILGGARQVVSIYPGNVVSKNLSGAIGPVLADVKKAEFLKKWGLPLPDRVANTRLIDFTVAKKALENKNIVSTELSGRALSALTRAASKSADFTQEEQDIFMKTASSFFNAGAQPFNAATASRAEVAGRQAAEDLRAEMNALHQEAKAAGVETGDITSPEEYAPLIRTAEAQERARKLGAASTEYDMGKGRRSWIELPEDEAARSIIGATSLADPNLVYLNPTTANERLREAARKAGKSEEEIAKAGSEYIEDPFEAFKVYSKSITNTIANKRFMDTLVRSGVVIQDAPQVRRLIREFEAMTMTVGLKGILPETRKAAEARLNASRKELESLVSAQTFDETVSGIQRIRANAAQELNVSRLRVQDLAEQVVESSAVVDELTPRYNQLRNQLIEYRTAFEETAQDLAEGQRAAKNVSDRIRRAKANVEKRINPLAEAQNEAARVRAIGGTPEEIAQADGLVARLGTDTNDYEIKLAAEQQVKAANDAELANIRGVRKKATDKGVKDIEDQIIAYEQAVTKRNALVEQLNQARTARNKAADTASRLEKSVALEQVTNLNTIIDNFIAASFDLKQYKLTNKITPKTSAAEKKKIQDEIARLEELATSAESILKKNLRLGPKEFKGVAAAYTKEVLDLSKRLTNEQLQVALVVTNEKKIQDLMEVVQNGLRDDATVMQAIGDMYRAFSQLRDIVPEASFKKLTAAQQELFDKSNAGKLQDKLIREEKAPGQVAQAFVDKGYEVLPTGKGANELYASASIVQAMGNLYNLSKNANEWDSVIERYLDPYLSMWKAAVTMGRGPGFTLNNLAGGFVMNHLGDVSVAETVKARNALAGVRDAAKRISKTNPELSMYDVNRLAEQEMLPSLNAVKIGDFKLGDLLVEFRRRGGFESTEITSALNDTIGATGGDISMAFRGGGSGYLFAEPARSKAEAGYRKVIDTLMTNPYQRKMNDMAQASEALLRFSAFVSGAARYGDLDAATNKMYILHFNYADLSNAERWVKKFVPFYSWIRNNIPAQMRATMLQPGKLQRYVRANDAFKEAIGADGEDSWMNNILPEYMDVSGGFASKFMFGDNNLGFFMKLPYTDLDKYFEADKTPVRTREVLNSLGLIKTPIELLSGVNLSTGAKYDPAGEIVPGILGFLPGTSEDAEGNTRAPGAVYRGLTNFLPMIGVGQRALAAGTAPLTASGIEVPTAIVSKPEQDKALATLINLVGGPIGAASLTPRSYSGELRRRMGTQGAAIDAAVAAQGIDETWARDMLSKGATPQELALMIAAGKGDKKAEQEFSKLTSKQRAKYQDLLGNL